VVVVIYRLCDKKWGTSFLLFFLLLALIAVCARVEGETSQSADLRRHGIVGNREVGGWSGLRQWTRGVCFGGSRCVSR
jgi:hypothetical protein